MAKQKKVQKKDIPAKKVVKEVARKEILKEILKDGTGKKFPLPSIEKGIIGEYERLPPTPRKR